MNEISCDICRDLMPLVHDGVASAESIAAVERHVTGCPACGALFEGRMPVPSEADNRRLMKEIQKKIRVFVGMVMMFGVFFGLSLTASSKLFLNCLIMPAIGITGYYLLRWKSLYIIPCLLFVTHLLTDAVLWIHGAEHLDFASLLVWAGIYSLFAVTGIIIAGLIHFACRKEG